MGIPKEEQDHLFERFFRAKNVTNIQGTGLGLNIVGKYLEAMNGKIDFISELDKGTTFTVTIPNE
jgi:signal transduction histidine kinase